jgi:hypothetical protein
MTLASGRSTKIPLSFLPFRFNRLFLSPRWFGLVTVTKVT